MKRSWIVLWLLILTLPSWADVKRMQHGTAADYTQAWCLSNEGMRDALSLPSTCQTPLHRFSIGKEAAALVFFIEDRFGGQALPRRLGAFPPGEIFSDPVVAHGKLWIFARQRGEWSLYSASLNSALLFWTKEPGVYPHEILAFALMPSGDVRVVEKGGEGYVHKTGGFGGGGSTLLWSHPETIPDSEAGYTIAQMNQNPAEPLVFGEFDLGKPGKFLSFSHRQPGNPGLCARVRFCPGPGRKFGPWSDLLEEETVVLDQQGQYLEYQLVGSVFHKGRLPQVGITYTEGVEGGESAVYASQGGSMGGGGLPDGSGFGDPGNLALASAPHPEQSGFESPSKETTGHGLDEPGRPASSSPRVDSPQSADTPTKEETIPQALQKPLAKNPDILPIPTGLDDLFSAPEIEESDLKEEIAHSKQRQLTTNQVANQATNLGTLSSHLFQEHPGSSGAESTALPAFSSPPGGASESPWNSEDPQAQSGGTGRTEDLQAQSSAVPGGQSASGESGSAEGGFPQEASPSANPEQGNGAGGEAEDMAPSVPAGQDSPPGGGDQSQAEGAPASGKGQKSRHGFGEDKAGAGETGRGDGDGLGTGTTGNPSAPTGEAHGAGEPCSNTMGPASLPQGGPRPQGMLDTMEGGEDEKFLLAMYSHPGQGNFHQGAAWGAISSASEETQEGLSQLLLLAWDRQENEGFGWWMWFAGMLPLVGLWLKRRKKGTNPEGDGLALSESPSSRVGYKVESIGERQGWSRVICFDSSIQAACLWGKNVVLTHEDQSVYSANVFSFSSGQEPFSCLGQIVLDDPPAWQAMTAKGLYVFAPTGTKKAAFFALHGEQIAARPQKIALPKGLLMVDRVFTRKGRLWLQGRDALGIRIASLAAPGFFGPAWHEDAVLERKQGALLAVSCGEDLLYAGVPSSDPDHIWFYGQPDRENTLWRPVAKTMREHCPSLFYADEKRGFWLAPQPNQTDVDCRFFCRDEEKHFCGRFPAHLTLPHSCRLLAMKVINGHMILLGKDETRSCFVLYDGVLGELFKPKAQMQAA
ncbi:MAG: hypothetical protein RBU29_07790 [bacterium]|nr:hypothetical protein [bacterium]